MKPSWQLRQQGLAFGDIYGRQIIISCRDGMKALDAAGKPIHDIPTAPIQTGNYYCGHLIGFQDRPTYLLLNGAPVVGAWTPVTCLTDRNSNVKAGLFKVFAQAHTAVNVSYRVIVYLRPGGSNWTAAFNSNTPEIRSYISQTGATCNAIGHSSVLPCPINPDDNTIEYWYESVPAAGGVVQAIAITQLGVFI